MIVKCDYCGKELFETDKEKMGVIASDATRRGYITKMPIFFGVPEFKIFCCKECKDKWFDENISEDKVQRGNAIVKELSNKLHSEEFQQSVIKGLQRLQNILKYGKC